MAKSVNQVPDIETLYTKHILRVKDINAYMLLKTSIRQVEKNFFSSTRWHQYMHQKFLSFGQTPLKIIWVFKTPHQLYKMFYQHQKKHNLTNRSPVFFWGLALPSQCRTVFHIYVNRFLIHHYDTQKQQFFDTIAHEYAHCLEMYIFGISKVGHSSIWYDIAQQCGCIFLEPYRSRLRKHQHTQVEVVSSTM